MQVEQEPADTNEEEIFSFDFRRYFTSLRKYAWLLVAIMALAITGAVIYTQRQPSVYQAQASVQIEPKLQDLLGQGQEIVNAGIGGTSDYYKQQKQVLGSYRLIRQSVDQHRLYTKVFTEAERGDRKLEDLIESATRRLQKRISVKYPDQNRIMYVVVRDTDPVLAAEIANAHVSTYVDYARGLLSTDTRKASGALSTEFDEAESKLREAEASLYKFQQDNGLLTITLENQQSLVSQGIAADTMKLKEAHARRLELAARLEQMKKGSLEDVLRSPVLLIGENTSFDALRAQYYGERNKLVELTKAVGPKNPEYQMQKAKMDDLYSALETETKRMIDGFEKQVAHQTRYESDLRLEVEKATKAALDLAPKILKYNDLLRQKRSAEDSYNILRNRLSTSELTDRMSRSIDSNVRPLDPALVPSAPVSPSLRINVLAASVLSLLFGMGLVVLIVFLDRSIKSAADAQQAAKHPVLGIIPMLEESELSGDTDKARDLYVHEHPTSRIAECCRSLRTNILFSAADRQLKTIVVSSANPREGKTTSVIYLGTTMAQSGQRVLLIDTDMRRPRLHASTGVSRQTGITNLIVGDLDYDAVIKTTDIPNLFVLPCGPLPPNPAEILMSQRFQTVLAELAKRFDRIILDSPPLQVVTDAVVLSQQTDGVILVAKAGKTLRDELKRSARQVRAVRGNIVGVIVNAIEPEGRSGYYYSYYGYKYKEDPDEAQAG